VPKQRQKGESPSVLLVGLVAIERQSLSVMYTNLLIKWTSGPSVALTNKSKAFKDDWDVRAYIESKELILSNPWVPEVLQDHFAKIRDSLLSLNYETRPRASELRLLSEAFCHILSPSVTQKAE
jgi:hypothetical protein